MSSGRRADRVEAGDAPSWRARDVALVALPILALLACAGAAFATDAPITKAQFDAGKSRIGETYRSEMEAGKTMSGNSKDICEVAAKGNRKVALAKNGAALGNTARTRYDALAGDAKSRLGRS